MLTRFRQPGAVTSFGDIPLIVLSWGRDLDSQWQAMQIAISTLGYFGTLLTRHAWIGLLGLAPIVLGVRKWMQRDRASVNDNPIASQTADEAKPSLFRTVFNPHTASVAAVTFANGGDNIGISIPLFARGSLRDLLVTILIFLLLVALWCYLAAILASQPTIAKLLDRYGHRSVPFVLIDLGVFILIDSGTLELLISVFRE